MKATLDIYKDEKSEWRWRVIHQNGNVMDASPEGYKDRRNLIKNLEGVAKVLAKRPWKGTRGTVNKEFKI